MRFRRLQIHLQTSDGPYGVTLDFPDGLVVIWADNSMGKSTCVKSILVALGMEAMLTTNRSDLPLPPSVKARLDSDSGEHEVIESEVFLEIENAKSERIVVRRTIKGTRDKNLITVYEGPALTIPNSHYCSHDYYVNLPGAAVRNAGFHNYLAAFLGWELPIVQTYDGNEYPLYLQYIFPYLIVEQTRGWSTIQPPLPSHFRIRDAHKRAIEFILNLDAHRNALKRQALQFEKSQVEAEWSMYVSRSQDIAVQVTAQVQSLPQKPIASWPPKISPILAVNDGTTWEAIHNRISSKQGDLDFLLNQDVPSVREVASSSKDELIIIEDLILERQTLLSRLLDSLETEEDEVKRIIDRINVIIDPDKSYS